MTAVEKEGVSLDVALRRLGVEHDPGHCGEGNVERQERERRNEAVAAILSALREFGSACAELGLSPSGDTSGGGESLQARVQPWMLACFGVEIAADALERQDRFIEEALELVQAGGYSKERVLALVDYVYGRPPGEPFQEVGGVMITLAALCLAAGLDMHEAGEAELTRIWTKVEQIRAKQAAKPTGSALPIAASPPPIGEEAVEKVARTAVDLFRAFVGGTACREVFEGRMTKEAADGWADHAVKTMEQTLRETCGLGHVALAGGQG